jgi:hypothetical protein
LRRTLRREPRVLGPHGKIKEKGRLVVAFAGHVIRILAKNKWRWPLITIVEKDTLNLLVHSRSEVLKQDRAAGGRDLRDR